MEDTINRLSVQLLACDDPVEAVFIGRKLREAISERIDYIYRKASQIKRASGTRPQKS